MTTPIRSRLQKESGLQDHAKDGLGAVRKSHRSYIEEDIRPQFADSLDIDEGLVSGNEGENRWDYLLGRGATSHVYGLEPHSASTGEVSVVIAKKQAALVQLRPHLVEGARIDAWYWVASGRVDFAPFEKAIRRLDQAGITFVGGTLRAKHLL